MTSDKQTTGNVAKPLTPTLSAAFHRTNKNKTPLTPKLANPGGYRTPRRLAQSEHPLSASKDEPLSVGHNFLSANVTPRSGSRNSRRDSSHPSPTAAASNNAFPSPHTPYSPSVAASASSVGGYRSERSPVRVGGKLEPARAGRARTLTAENQHASRPNSSSEVSSGPRFFHASDAHFNSFDQDTRPDARPKPQGRQPSAATFIYANGEQERQQREEDISPAGPRVKRRSLGQRPVPAPSPLTASPRLRSPRVNDSNARLSDGAHSSVGSKVASNVGSQIDDASETGSRQGLGISQSVEGPPPTPIIKHAKSSSLDSASNSTHPREALRPSPIIISPSDSQVDSSAATSEPIPGLRPRIFSNGSTGSAETHGSGSQSPTKSDATSQQNHDPHAGARRERKILDLEISNSSLLAINRTLEREMRKQNAELRKFRRLSRAGRISMAPSNRSVSLTALSTTSEMDEGVSELSSLQTPEDMSDFSDDDSCTEEGVMSPDSLGDNDARKQRDEKRFFVDLAKHQEVLADSQKMNQSLKRCLGWTEELIKEGKKALEYNVHVNDIDLGGRVLAPEEMGEIGESARGLLSPTDDYRDDSTPESNESNNNPTFDTDTP